MNGVVTEYDIPAPSANPTFITTAPDGALWFTQAYQNLIRRMTMTGEFTTFTVPTPNGRPDRILWGPDGNLWFGEDAGKIGRMTPKGVFTEFDFPSDAPYNPGVTGMAVGPDGAIWFCERNIASIGRITTGLCEAGPNTLCLKGQRFEVTVDWTSASTGTSGHATAVPLTTDTGYFWFFSANNVELMVKVVDGRAFNDRFWVFGGALTNVGYVVTVRDTMTGETRTYTNAEGTLASFADTNAFPG